MQFVKPIWGVQLSPMGPIAGRSTLELARDSQRWGKRYATYFVTADSDSEAINIACRFNAGYLQAESRQCGHNPVVEARNGARVIMAPPRW